ncbi:uncharacterized protein LOC128737623 [Sabethes cyaneus]|uniref:uncharacterized protein LOC128737623 n=1 Tax=Sabethes cyaneus TaxID=53552 RepID=UPI00237E2B71|nr:uncharacterized protein LOC128737623 [Sabethes cyaneus]
MHISEFTEEALKSRCNWTIELTEYKRREEYGVVEIYFLLEITAAAGLLSAALIVPGLMYLADQDFNEGRLTEVRRTHYFDAASGEEISKQQAEEQHSKNRQAYQLDKEGNQLYSQGKYQQSYDKFSAAYNMCSKGYREEARFKKNRDIAKNKVEAAEKLEAEKNANRQADQLYREGLDLYKYGGKYKEAHEKFSKAYNLCTSGYSEEEKFKTYRDMAKKEMEAANLNADGDKLFQQGKFSEALNRYQQAYDKSDFKPKLYSTNLNKAKAEVEKRKQAENLRLQGKKLWDDAWCAEDEDKPEEASRKFQEANRLLQAAFELASDSREIARLSRASSLKVEGNALFNEGIRSQHEGVRLLEAAQRLKQQRDYRAAEGKFVEAKDKFNDCLVKFEQGCKCDSRFVPCVEFTREQLETVLESIEQVQQLLLKEKFKGLNVRAATSESVDPANSHSSRDFSEIFASL